MTRGWDLTRGEPGGCHEYGFQHQAGGDPGRSFITARRQQRGGWRRSHTIACQSKRHGNGPWLREPQRFTELGFGRSVASGVFDTAAASVVFQSIDALTGEVVQQFPDDAMLRRRAYFHSLDLQDSPSRPLATDVTA